MNHVQCRLARISLGWSKGDLARASRVRTRTVVNFEDGKTVTSEEVHSMRWTMERRGVKFVDRGEHAGGIVPPPEKAPCLAPELSPRD